MAASWQPHFHIVDSATPGDSTTTGEWGGYAPNLRPRVLPETKVIVNPRYSLNGNLRPHVLLDGSLNPVVFKDWQLLVKCDNWADVETWQALLGKIKWFIFHWHDAAAHNSYTQRVLIYELQLPEARGVEFNSIALPVLLKDATVRT